MAKDQWINDTITLRGKEVPIRVGYLQQGDLRFYEENPRIYSIISSEGGSPSQEDIERTLLKREHVKQLIHSIRANGGLTDPVFVQDGTYIVLEGNSRLAAYRALSRKDAIKWGVIKCKVLPKDLEEDAIFSLLGEYHIIGKQDWAPYEQAGYLFRRVNLYGSEPSSLASDLGLTTDKVNRLIQVYSFMLEHNDKDISRWSYFDELLKSRKIKKFREEYSSFDKVMVSKIKNGEIIRAADIRDSLPKIAVASKKIIKDFLSGKYDFYKSVELAKSGGFDRDCYLRLKSFRNWFVKPEIKKELLGLPDNILKKAWFELRKIRQNINLIEKRIEPRK